MLQFLYITLPKLQCVFKSKTGIDCPGCGIQRSIEYLLNGDLKSSIEMYPGLLPLAFTGLFLGLHLWKNTIFTLRLATITFIVTTIIVLGNYILKFL